MSEATTKNKNIGSVFDLLGKSYEIVKRNWVAFAVVNILTILSSFFPADTSKDKFDKNQFNTDFFPGFSGIDIGTALGAGLIVLLFIIIGIFLYAMSMVLQVRASEGRRPSVGELFDAAKGNWLRLLGLNIIMGFIIAVGILLLIVPGIIAIGRLFMAPYFMVDKNLGIKESLKRSNEMGKKHFWKVWAAVGIVILITLLTMIFDKFGIIGALVGTFIFIIFSVVPALRYQQLKKL